MTQNKYNKGDHVVPRNIKAGDEVEIASGDWFKVAGHTNNGLWVENTNGGESIVDLRLVTNHRPAFDWGTVKIGDKMRKIGVDDIDFHFLEYVSCEDYNDIEYDMISTVAKIGHHWQFSMVKPSELTRHPEGDIKEEV